VVRRFGEGREKSERDWAGVGRVGRTGSTIIGGGNYQKKYELWHLGDGVGDD